MTTHRLGCVSGAGLIAAAVTLLLSVGVAAALGGRWFSPGPLHVGEGQAVLGGVRSHADTGGRCQACHPAPWSPVTLTPRCLACHTEIQDELADPASLHGALSRSQAAMQCRDCHTEHGGPDASLTRIDPAGFPHDAVGYSLAGHTEATEVPPLACADCHTEALSRFDISTCGACHRQADAAYIEKHVAAFGAACLGCHDGVDRYGRDRFDHNRLGFSLLGRHAGAECTACHAGALTAADLQATPGACEACHADPAFHPGSFGTTCAGCHTPAGWLPASFDRPHPFPLSHGDARGVCRTCHPAVVSSFTCFGCHDRAEMVREHAKEDIPDISDCLSCHPDGRKAVEDDDD